jgi:hypothetical protein
MKSVAASEKAVEEVEEPAEETKEEVVPKKEENGIIGLNGDLAL